VTSDRIAQQFVSIFAGIGAVKTKDDQTIHLFSSRDAYPVIITQVYSKTKILRRIISQKSENLRDKSIGGMY